MIEAQVGRSARLKPDIGSKGAAMCRFANAIALAVLKIDFHPSAFD